MKDTRTMHLQRMESRLIEYKKKLLGIMHDKINSGTTE